MSAIKCADSVGLRRVCKLLGNFGSAVRLQFARKVCAVSGNFRPVVESFNADSMSLHLNGDIVAGMLKEARYKGSEGPYKENFNPFRL